MDLVRPKVAIIGAGAVGGYYGARLVQSGLDVHFLVRSDYDVVRERGLVIRSLDGDFTLAPSRLNIYKDVREMPKVDLVIVALKATDNALYQPLITPLLHEATTILTLQNGLGNEQQLADLFGPSRIVGGLAFVCINRVAPGEISHLDHGAIGVGEFASRSMQRITDIAKLFERANVKCRAVENLMHARWEKLVWNTPFNGLGALLDATTDRLIATPQLTSVVEALMTEVIAIAKAHGIELSADCAARQIDKTRGVGAYRTSTHLDRQAGRPMEIDAIFTRPLRAAQERNVPVPRLELLEFGLQLLNSAALIKPHN